MWYTFRVISSDADVWIAVARNSAEVLSLLIQDGTHYLITQLYACSMPQTKPFLISMQK